MSKVCFVTATIGRPTLAATCQAVRAQTMHCAHVVFIHGLEFRDAALSVLKDFPEVIKFQLPTNLGREGLGASPLYAAAPFLLPHEFLLPCDDDNWPDASHAESLVSLMRDEDLDWAYSLRTLRSADGTFLMRDSCESLGAFRNIDGTYLVDQSCFAFRRAVALELTQAWLTPQVADRAVLHHLMHARTRFGGTGLYSMNYRLSKDGSGSTNSEGIAQGNAHFRAEFGDPLPWEAPHRAQLCEGKLQVQNLPERLRQ